MHFAKDVQKDILGDNKYDSSYLTSELKELGAEIKKRDWPAIKDEVGDVAFSAQMIAHQKSGINFPMIGADGSIKKYMDRRAIWKQIFKDHGGEFHTDYLKGGSNYARPLKVQQALGMAGIKIDDAAASAVSAKHMEKSSAEGLSRHGLQISSHDPVDRARTLQQQIANYTQQSERDLRIQKILDRIRDTVPANMDPPELKPHLETRAAKLINAMERDNPLQRSPVLDAFKRNLRNQQELTGIHGEAEVGSNQIWLNRRSLTGDRYAEHRGKIPDALLEDIRHPFQRAKVSPRGLIAHEAWHAKNPTIPATTWGETPLTPQVNLGKSETLAKYYGGLREVPGENLVSAHARGLNTALKYQAGRMAIPGYYSDHTLATAPQRLTMPLPSTIPAATPVDLSKVVTSTAKGVGKGLGVGIPISMGLDAVAPTTMSTPGQQAQHPVTSYLNDAAGHMLDSTKAITGGAATGAALSGGAGAIPGAVAGGIGDLVHKGWNAAKDVGDIAGNLGGAVIGNWNAHKLQNKLTPVGNPSTVVPPMGNSIRNAPSAGGLIKGGADHHNVYVVELLQAALKRKKLLRDNPNADHSKEPLYIGSTGHPVEQRFSNHKSNIKGNVFVQKYGLKLRPDLYQRYNPMSFSDAEAKEIALAKELRANGHAVVGGNPS